MISTFLYQKLKTFANKFYKYMYIYISVKICNRNERLFKVYFTFVLFVYFFKTSLLPLAKIY